MKNRIRILFLMQTHGKADFKKVNFDEQATGI